MRIPKFLSFSSLSVFEKDAEEFFYRYLCDIRQEKPPQMDYMAVGSCFDAIVKSRISNDLFGYDRTIETGYGLRKLIVDQCQEQTLPECIEVAADLWEQYVDCGAYGNLLEDLEKSPVEPRMEFSITSEVDGVPILGKPDLVYQTSGGLRVIADWKVSGSVSKWGVSPQQGYKIALDGRGTNTNGKSHKKFVPFEIEPGVVISAVPMNETTDYWADQLAGYAWCLGEPVGGTDWIARIEQLAVRPGLKSKSCVHIAQVSAESQLKLRDRFVACWEAVKNDHVFPELSVEHSRAKADMLARAMTTVKEPIQNSLLDDSVEIDGWF